MCDPVSAGIATAIGVGASLYGGMQSAKAQHQAAQAVADQNRQTQIAQNEGFTQRLQAGLKQTAAQSDASQEILRTRGTAADQMRQSQMKALQDYQDTINAQNTQAESLRQTGDTAAKQLLAATQGQDLADAQSQRQAQQEALVAQHLPPEGPQVTDPVERAAVARRTAEAATNIRNYGSAIARSDAYSAPATEAKLAAADAAYGIMPAQQAEKLLQAGSATRLLPSKTAYQAATGTGEAQDILLQSRGQNALDAAGLSYGNATDLANLQQSNTQTIAKNISDQAQANAAYKASQGQMISSLGKLATYGAGYFGGFGGTQAAPGWAPGAGGIFTNISGSGAPIGATTDIPGVTMPGSGFSLSSLFR